MPKSRIPSPARSQGAATARRNRPRRSHSVGSPAQSMVIGRLTTMIEQFKDKNMDSFALSPMNSRRSVLTDNTDIEEPRRKSWWKKLNENSRDVMEVLENNEAVVANNVIEEIIDIEVLSQENKNYTLDLPESSDSESINSIVLPQRRLFTQKENHPQKIFGQLIGRRESLNKHQKNNTANHEQTIKAGTKELFGTRRNKPIFPVGLLNISPNKTVADKTKELSTETKVQVRNIFGNRPANKRKNVFAEFIVSESEDEIPEIQPKIFSFPKKVDQRRGSSTSRSVRGPSPSSSVTTDIEMDDWKHLPSSTMVENQIEDIISAQTPVKKARLSKLSETKESEAGTNFSDKTSQSNKSTRSAKNKSKQLIIEEEIDVYGQVNTSKSLNKSKRSNNSIESNNKSKLSPNKEKTLEKIREFESNADVSKKNNHTASQEKENITIVAEKAIHVTKGDQEKRIESEITVHQDLEIEVQAAEEIKQVYENATQHVYDKDNKNQLEQVTDNVNQVIENEGVTEADITKIEKLNQTPVAGNNDSIKHKKPDNADFNLKTQNIQMVSEEGNESPVSANEEKSMNDSQKNKSQENQVMQNENELEQSENNKEQAHVDDSSHVIETEENQTIDQLTENESGEEQITDDQSKDVANEEPDEIEGSENKSQEIENENEDEENVEESDESEQEEEQNEEEVNESQEIASEEIAEDSEENSQEVEGNNDETVDSSQRVNSDQEVESEDDQAIASDDEADQEDEVEEMEEDEENEEDTEDNQDEGHEEQTNEEIEGTPDATFDTTGRNRKKDLTDKSPEVILHDNTNQNDSFTPQGRNTSVRQTKTMYKSMNIRPSMAPPRDSTGISDGTKNSSAEGSGWDSHRTTRKTLRQTFGKDFTLRKSLRAMVMEKSAKQRQTEYMELHSETVKFPQANSTEMPDESNREVMEVEETVEESDHEVSIRTRQTTLETYLQKIKQQNLEKKLKMEEAVRNSLKAPSGDVMNLFKVPTKPARQMKPQHSKSKKPIKSVIPLDDLPSEVIEDMKYKPPKRFQPTNASWITKRLYKYLETKLEPKYDYKARVRAEKLVQTIYHYVKDLRRVTVAGVDATDNLKHEMARLNIVKTHFEFYEFFHEFMPREVRIKVVPDIVNKISLPRHGVFSDILRGNTVQG